MKTNELIKIKFTDIFIQIRSLKIQVQPGALLGAYFENMFFNFWNNKYLKL